MTAATPVPSTLVTSVPAKSGPALVTRTVTSAGALGPYSARSADTFTTRPAWGATSTPRATSLLSSRSSATVSSGSACARRAYVPGWSGVQNADTQADEPAGRTDTSACLLYTSDAADERSSVD